MQDRPDVAPPPQPSVPPEDAPASEPRPSSPRSYRLNGSPLAPPQRYTLDGPVLSYKDDWDDWDLNLQTVTRAAFVDNRFERVRATRLDLFTPGSLGSKVTRIERPSGLLRRRKARGEFTALMRDVAATLAALDPDMPVSLGEYGSTRWSNFAAALVWVGAMALIAWTQARVGIEGGLGILVLALVGVSALLGLYYAWRMRPWRSPETVPVAAFAAVWTEGKT